MHQLSPDAGNANPNPSYETYQLSQVTENYDPLNFPRETYHLSPDAENATFQTPNYEPRCLSPRRNPARNSLYDAPNAGKG